MASFRIPLAPALLIVLAAGCSLLSEASPPASVQGRDRVTGANGFSFQPPTGDDWTETLEEQQVTYFKKLDPGQASLFFGAIEGPLKSEMPTQDSLVSFVRSRKDNWGSEGRYTDVVASIAVEPSQPSCVRYDMIAHDHAAKNKGDLAYLVMRTVGRFCLHPDDRSVGLDIFYSVRYIPTLDPATLIAEGDAFLASVKFESRPKNQKG
ncbi:hypothetical protein [Arenimonas sp.]|uniref:hypothetical protein n=1 Tax=Arenimonas sp. TaxID=1872635 RepID=UPI0039E2C85F